MCYVSVLCAGSGCGCAMYAGSGCAMYVGSGYAMYAGSGYATVCVWGVGVLCVGRRCAVCGEWVCWGGGYRAYLYMISIDVIIFLVNKLHPCLVNCNVEKGE